MSGHKKRRKGGGHEEGHENAERWLLTYADMITLLMVLFIVLFAISQVDQKKFAELKTGFAAGFGAPTVATDGGQGAISDPGEAGGAFSVGAQAKPAKTDAQTQQLRQAVADADRARQDKLAHDAEVEAKKLKKLQEQIARELKKKGLEKSVKFHLTERGLDIAIVTDKVIFGGDSAVLQAGGARVLDAIAPVIAPIPNSISVEGHTNHLGVSNPLYPTLWELSAARATTVVRYLISDHGISPARLSATGYAQERPLFPITDPRAITQNRRVEIVILSTLPPEARALLPGLGT
jgi:chemotaxis protein MotB